MRGWSHGEAEQVSRRRCGSARCGWCWSTRASTPRSGRRSRSIAEKMGCTAETLRNWVRQAERDQGVRPGLTTDERERLKELERENRELRRANEILRKASAYFAQAELDRRREVMVAFIDEHRDVYGVEPICARAADRPVDVLRAQGPARSIPSSARRGPSATTRWCSRSSACGTRTIASTAPRRSGGSSARGDRGRALHGGAADARDGPAGRGAGRAFKVTTTTPTSGGTVPAGSRQAAVQGRRARTSSGSPTSPTSRPGAASSTSPSSSTSSRGASSAGGCRARCARDLALDALEQALYAPAHTRAASCTTATAACSTSRSATPSGWPRPASSPRSAASATRYDNALAETIIGLYKTEVIHRRGPWRTSRPSSSPRSNGSTGSTTGACSSRSETSLRPSPRPPIMPSLS